MDRVVTTRTYTARYTGPSEFYSGIGSGDQVLVEERVTSYTFEGTRRASASISIQADGGPWLSLGHRVDQLEDIEPVLVELPA